MEKSFNESSKCLLSNNSRKKTIFLGDNFIKEKPSFLELNDDNSNLDKSLLNELYYAGNFYEYFRMKVKNVGVENFFNVLDFDTFDYFFKNQNMGDMYKMYVALVEQDINLFIRSIIDKDNILNDFLGKTFLFSAQFANIDFNSFEILMNYIGKNGYLYDMFFLSEVKYDILKKYSENDIDEDLLLSFVKNNLEFRKDFFEHDIRSIRFIEESKLKINSILEDNIKISKELLYSDILFQKLKSQSMVGFRSKLNKLLAANPSIVIENKVNNYEDALIESFDLEKGFFKYYSEITMNNLAEKKDDSNNLFMKNFKYVKDENELNNLIKKESNRILKELVIDRLFKDNYYNVIINTKEIIRYQQHIDKNNEQSDSKFYSKFYSNLIHKKKNGLDKAQVDFYNKILDIDNLSNLDIIEIYKNNRNKNFSCMFYEDIRMCRELAHKEMIEGLYIPRKKDKDLSKKFGTNVYLLDGEPFNMIIRMLKRNFEEEIKNVRECFSLIGNDNTSRISGGICYGYNKIDLKDIINVSEVDAFSSDFINDEVTINRIMTSDEINSYAGISEIQIKTNNGKALKPSYIVSYNKIEINEIEESKRLHIPIILIDESKYNTKELIVSDHTMRKNGYINSEYDEDDYISRLR